MSNADKICLFCGQSYQVKGSRKEDYSRSRFCSKKCGTKHWKNNNRSRVSQHDRKFRQSVSGKKSRLRQLQNGLKTYTGILERCNNHNSVKYKLYGARGIRCILTLDEFREVYFRTDTCELCGQTLSDDDRNKQNGRTLDRINSSGHYSECNVRVLCRSCNSSCRTQ